MIATQVTVSRLLSDENRKLAVGQKQLEQCDYRPRARSTCLSRRLSGKNCHLVSWQRQCVVCLAECPRLRWISPLSVSAPADSNHIVDILAQGLRNRPLGLACTGRGVGNLALTSIRYECPAWHTNKDWHALRDHAGSAITVDRGRCLSARWTCPSETASAATHAQAPCHVSCSSHDPIRPSWNMFSDSQKQLEKVQPLTSLPFNGWWEHCT